MVFFSIMTLLSARVICPQKILFQKKWRNKTSWPSFTSTSGYATWFTAGGAIRITHYDVTDDDITRVETITDGEKRRPPHPMKSSELSNGENHIALRQLLQNRKWRHWWRHNLGSRWKLQKMARENFSIGAFYNITKKSGQSDQNCRTR